MFLEQLDQPTSQQTEYLLKSISTRLSGREDCKGINYIVTINHNGVTMTPLIYVYKDKHSRRECDRMDIVSFVHKYKMHGARLDGFVFGKYEYEMSADFKRRRWRKIE